MNRIELIKFIKANDALYLVTDFSKFTEAQLVIIKVRIELEIERQRKKTKN